MFVFYSVLLRWVLRPTWIPISEHFPQHACQGKHWQWPKNCWEIAHSPGVRGQRFFAIADLCMPVVVVEVVGVVGYQIRDIPLLPAKLHLKVCCANPYCLQFPLNCIPNPAHYQSISNHPGVCLFLHFPAAAANCISLQLKGKSQVKQVECWRIWTLHRSIASCFSPISRNFPTSHPTAQLMDGKAMKILQKLTEIVFGPSAFACRDWNFLHFPESSTHESWQGISLGFIFPLGQRESTTLGKRAAFKENSWYREGKARDGRSTQRKIYSKSAINLIQQTADLNLRCAIWNLYFTVPENLWLSYNLITFWDIPFLFVLKTGNVSLLDYNKKHFIYFVQFTTVK